MNRMYNPPHPGEVLKDTVLAKGSGLTVTAFAKQLKVSRQMISMIANCRASVTADMALRLAKALGGSAESWLRMQEAYDLWHARKKPQPKIKPIAFAEPFKRAAY
ncbi:MAG: HigA family addiction module antitoxin [Betaproteobacteria bacterium]